MQRTIFVLVLVLTVVFFSEVRSEANSGTGGIPAVLEQLAAIQRRLDVIEQNQKRADEQLSQVNGEVAFVKTDLRAHRLGSVDAALDVSMTWCFKAEGKGKIEPKTLLRGIFSAQGTGGIDAYGNGLTGQMRLGTQGRVDTGWEAAAGMEASICVSGAVAKALLQGGNPVPLNAALMAAAAGPTPEQQDLLARALVAQTETRDRLVDALDRYGVDGTRLPEAIERGQNMDMDLNNPLTLLTEVSDNIRDRVADLPLPGALRNKLKDGPGIVEAISDQLSDPQGIFCDLANNDSLGDKLRARMDQACAADGERIKDSIDQVKLVVNRIRAKLPKGRDPLIDALGFNDWKIGVDD
jgi:hypothetical protein